MDDYSCCPDFKKAKQEKTDNEGWMELIAWRDGKWMMGTALQPIVYCPWCGKKIPEV